MSVTAVLAPFAGAARLLAVGPSGPGVPVPQRWLRVVGGAALVVLLLVDVVQLAEGGQEDVLVVLLLAVAHAGAVAVAVRHPVPGWRLSFAATAAAALLVPAPVEPWVSATLTLHVVVLFLVALSAPWRVTLVAVAVDLAGYAVVRGLVAGELGGGLVGPALVLVLGAGLGVAMQAQRGAASGLAAARSGAAAEQARRAVLEERTRIARDMHDVVAHHLSALAVRAESAPHRLADTAPDAAAEFRTLAEAAREALSDMRRLLGVLRADEPDRPSAPAPGLDGIPTLVATLRESGVDVALAVHGPPRPVPDDVGLAGYRVVQEALSNAARHATGAPVRVQLEWLPRAVRLRVDNGPGRGEALPGGGTGLIGMRERVAAVGGELHAGPHDGGYAVEATLPTEPS